MLDAPERLSRQLRFIVEVDRLKQVLRQTTLIDGSRRENSAEHSWHLALMATVLAEYADGRADVARVLRMLLLHDVVEVDAGDTFAFDVLGYASKADRERAAAERLFGLLPVDQGSELRALWEEFEAAESADARFANALDRLQPLLHNYHTGGGTWKRHGIARGAVLRRMAPIAEGAPELWPFVLQVIEAACAAGYIAEDVEGAARS